MSALMWVFIIIAIVALAGIIIGIFVHPGISIASGILLIVMVFCIFYQNKKLQKEKIVFLEKAISQLEEEICPMQFKITSIKNSEIEVDIVFLDLKGKKTGKEKLKIQGNELHVEFQNKELKHGTYDKKKKKLAETIEIIGTQYLFYPYCIYTEIIPPSQGLQLSKLYEDNGFPTIYKGFESFLEKDDLKLKKAYEQQLVQDFGFLLNNDIEGFNSNIGYAVHDMKDISQFKKGYVYSVICHPHTGAVEIRRN